MSCVVYNCNNKTFHYQDFKFIYQSVLRVEVNFFYTKPVKIENFLYVPRLWHEDIVELALKSEDDYDFIVFNESVFLGSNIKPTPVANYTNIPTGSTCAKALIKLIPEKLVKDSDFLCVQDDGTKSLVGSFYFALRVLEWLKQRRSLSKQFHAPIYTDNYYSTSNSNYTRAKHKFDYFNYFGNWDFILTPSLKTNDQSLLIKKLEKESKKGYVIFGSFEKLKDLKYSRRVKVNKGVFIFNSKFSVKKLDCTINSAKLSTKQLIDHLRKDFSN